MIPVFAAVAAIVPSLLLLWYFRSRDENPEPGHVVWKTFALGALCVVPVLLVAFPLMAVGRDLGDPYARGAYDAFLTAAIPEEFFKFVVLWFYAARHVEFDEPMDGIVYGATASLGFATLENVLYVGQGGFGLALLRAFTAVPCHAFMGAIMGSYVGRARFGEPANRGRLLVAALLWPTLLHGLYDFPLLTLKALQKAGDAYGPIPIALAGATLLVLIVEWIWMLRVTRRMRREQLALIAAGGRLVSSLETAGAPASETLPAARGLAAPRSRGFVGWLQLVFGALLASGAGLLTLGLVLGLTSGHAQAELGAAGVVTTFILVGFLPLVLGLWLFVRGLRRRARC